MNRNITLRFVEAVDPNGNKYIKIFGTGAGKKVPPEKIYNGDTLHVHALGFVISVIGRIKENEAK